MMFSSSAAFSQKKAGQPTFTASANKIIVSNDSSEIHYLGTVNIKGENFRFEGADSVIYTKKENALMLFNCKKQNVKNVQVTKLKDSQKEIIILKF